MEIVHKSIEDVMADDSDLDYLGKIDKDTWFVVYRPEQDGEWDTFRVSIGSRDNLKEVEVTGGMRYGNGTTIVNTVKGTFFFPHPNRKGKKPLFNSRPIELF